MSIFAGNLESGGFPCSDTQFFKVGEYSRLVEVVGLHPEPLSLDDLPAGFGELAIGGSSLLSASIEAINHSDAVGKYPAYYNCLEC